MYGSSAEQGSVACCGEEIKPGVANLKPGDFAHMHARDGDETHQQSIPVTAAVTGLLGAKVAVP